MTDGTLTRAQIGEAVHKAVGLSRHDCAALVDQVLDVISDVLVNGQGVKISSFGSFQIREKKQRLGRNPKTGEEVPISPRRVLSFKASHILKDMVNQPDKKVTSS